MKYSVLPLSIISIARMKLVKETALWLENEDHSRWVFVTRSKYELNGERNLFVKIWNSTYVRRDNILAAIRSGFYDNQTTPGLHAVIEHNGVCRGYATKRGKPNRKLDSQFYELIKEKTAKTGYFHVQLSPYHMVKYGNRYSLIDLEAVYHLHDLPYIVGKFDHQDYQKYVTALYNETSPSPYSSEEGNVERRNLNRLMLRPARVIYRKSRGTLKRMMEWKSNTFGIVGNHCHLIEM